MGPDPVIRQQLPRQCATVPKKSLRGFKICSSNYFYHCIVKLSFRSLRIGSKKVCPAAQSRVKTKILIFSTFSSARWHHVAGRTQINNRPFEVSARIPPHWGPFRSGLLNGIIPAGLGYPDTIGQGRQFPSGQRLALLQHHAPAQTGSVYSSHFTLGCRGCFYVNKRNLTF